MNDATTVATTEAESDLAEAIRSAATLAELHASAWSGKVQDDDARRAAAAASGAKLSAYNATLDLMNGARANLKAVTDTQKEARNVHIELTRPWGAGSQRLLPHSNWLHYFTTLGNLQKKYEAALAAFIASYPADMLVAQQSLNEKNDPVWAAKLAGLYPRPDKIASKFSFELEFDPIAEGSTLLHMPQGVGMVLGERFEKRQARNFDKAMASARERVTFHVGNLVTQLDKDEGEKLTFKSAAVENVRELAPLLKSWNLLGDERMAQLADDVEKLVAGTDMAGIKANAQLRGFILQEAKRIVEVVENWEEGE